MKAERELDALISEKILGWVWAETDYGLEGLFPPNDHPFRQLTSMPIIFDSNGYWLGMPFYSTNIADAWEVVEKLDFTCSILTPCPANYQKYSVVISKGEVVEQVIAETAPLAICLAFLKANGIDVGGEVKP
jgi:hypothetical protein